MTLRRFLFIAIIAAVSTAAFAPSRAGAAPTAQDKDNYERLLAILVTGSKENKEAARESLRAMGDAGIELLKADAATPDSPRGAMAWSFLKELLLQTDADALRDLARKNFVDLARDWNASYKARSADRARQTRQKDILSDYVFLLLSSDRPKDFDLLLKNLRYSLIVSEQKIDFGAEFEVWDRIWKFITERAAISESPRDLAAWQAALDEQFRRYSLLKDYSARKAIQAYHTATLQVMQRAEALKRKPPAPAPETPAAPTDKPETPAPAPAPKDEGAAE